MFKPHSSSILLRRRLTRPGDQASRSLRRRACVPPSDLTRICPVYTSGTLTVPEDGGRQTPVPNLGSRPHGDDLHLDAANINLVKTISYGSTMSLDRISTSLDFFFLDILYGHSGSRIRYPEYNVRIYSQSLYESTHLRLLWRIAASSA